MTTVEDEKGYEIAKKYLREKYGDDYVDFIETEGQSYLDGYEQGYEDCRHYAHDYYKPKWHDLREDPNDLPTKENVIIRCVLNNGNEVICETDWYSPTEDEIGYGKLIIQFYCNDDWIDTNDVIAWCELPKFKDRK